MKNSLPFMTPFTGFSTLNFISCFASVYVYLEYIPLRGGDGKCAQSRGERCNSCGHCETSNPLRDLDPYYFLFDTMCGRSSLRLRYDGRLTEMQRRIGETEEDGCGMEDTVDFLFGFVGRQYRLLTSRAAFQREIAASMEAGRPVIAKVRTGGGRFRVITGCDGDRLICPNFVNAQDRPQAVPCLDELDALYLIGERESPRFTAADGLKRIRTVMEHNLSEGLLTDYTARLGWYGDGMSQTDSAGREMRMQRVCDTMWHLFNSHNFAEVFREIRDGRSVYDKISDMKKLQTPAIRELCAHIGGPCYGYTHDLAWALIGLNERTKGAWNTHYACGWSEMTELVLTQIRRNDQDVLEAVRQMLELLDGAADC